MQVQPNFLTTARVAKLLNVSVDTVRQWRQPKFADSPRRLVGTRISPNRYIYTVDQLHDFCTRNPSFYDRLQRNSI